MSVGQSTDDLGTCRSAVVVVNYGSHDLVERCLRFADELPDVLLVVVDNFTTSDELAAVRDLAAIHGWTLVEAAVNLGFGGAVNLGVRRAIEVGAERFLLVNPDAEVTARVAAELLGAVADPAVLVAPRIVDSDGAPYFVGSEVGLRSGRIRSVVPPETSAGTATSRLDEPAAAWITGACMAFHRVLFEQLDGFADGYFMYWEDVDFAYRAGLAGAAVIVRQDLVALHDEGGTQTAVRGRAKSPLYYRYNTRNRLVFAARNLDRASIVRWMWRTPAVSWEILLRGGRRQIVHSPQTLLAAVRGSLAGLGIAAAALVKGRRRPAPARRARVLMAHPSAELYGADRVFAESVSGVVESGADVTVTLPVGGPLVADLESRGATVVITRTGVLQKAALRPSGFLRMAGRATRGLPASVRLVRRKGQDGVYVSTITVPLWIVIARLLGRRTTVHVHEAERSAPGPVRRLLAAPAGLAHHVVTNSEFSLDTLTPAGSRVRQRSTVLHNAVPGPVGPQPAREVLDRPVRLLFVGRLSPRKGPQFALEVLAELVRRGVDARLTLLGSVYTGYEWFEAELRDAANRPDLAGRVEFAGFQPDVWPQFAAADIVLIPSLVDEPFGNTAVEAILAQRPVVVSATSGLREAAAGYQAALVVTPGATTEWADAVERIVGEWPAMREAVGRDAELARRRHAPELYRRRIADLVASARRRAAAE